jgi:hypothetical protein
LEPGQKYDPETDLNFVFGVGNYPQFGFMLLINGNPAPDFARLSTGKRYRVRFINITDNESDLRLRFLHKDELVTWKVVASQVAPTVRNMSARDILICANGKSRPSLTSPVA